MTDQHAPIGPRLLGEILGSGAVSATAAPLIASAIELDALSAQRLPSLWADGDDGLADIVFAVETAWNDLLGAWQAARAALEQIASESATFKAQTDEIGKTELAAKLLEIDRVHGGPDVREQLVDRLRDLVEAHAKLPFVETCECCGRMPTAAI